jgi:hypothetical protein
MNPRAASHTSPAALTSLCHILLVSLFLGLAGSSLAQASPRDGELGELRQKLATGKATQEEKEFLTLAKQLVPLENRSLAADLLLWKAECLVETDPDLAKAQTCLDLVPEGAEGSALLNYVRARLLFKHKKAEEAATKLAQMPVERLIGFRGTKAMEIYQAAAQERIAPFKLDPAKLQPVAGVRLNWLPAATSLATSLGVEKPSLDWLLLSVWADWDVVAPKLTALDALLTRSIDLEKRENGGLLLTALHCRRAKLREAADALQDYLEAVRHAQAAKLRLRDYDELILAPALGLVETFPQDHPFEAKTRQQIAELYAVRGALLAEKPRAEDHRDAARAFEQALRHHKAEDRVRQVTLSSRASAWPRWGSSS